MIRVSVALAGADGTLLPVPRHALLVSDEPPTSTPRRIVTALDGTASIRLAPGTYTVESDQPVAFQGREYQWRQTLAVAAGQDVRLELTTANAEAGPITAASAGPAGKTSGATDAIMLWQDSIVALWTPTMPASGFVIDARGLVATSHQVVGASSSVEVQIGPTVKVSGRVLVADRENDVAVLWIDPAAIASIKPVPLGCGEAPATPLTNGQEVVALGMPPGRPTSVSFGTVTRVTSRAMLGDLRLPRGSAGGPVFANGAVVGLTSFTAEKESAEPDEARVIRIDAVCDGVASAGAAMASAARAGRHPAAGRAHPADGGGVPAGRGQAPDRQLEPLPGRVVGVRHRLHHAGVGVRRAEGADGLQQLGRVRQPTCPACCWCGSRRGRAKASGPRWRAAWR